MSKEIKVYTDGGARGNPGPAAIGIIAYSNNEELFRASECIGLATNNIAEYTALIRALSELIARKTTDLVVVNLDSELIVKQMNGEYKVKNERLKKLHAQAVAMASKFTSVQYVHVTRDKNKIADKLVNNALDKAGK